MGIRLITEVMDWAPVTLTQREHKVLIVLAEDARDGDPGEVDDRGREKRVIWQPVESPAMLRRARVSRTQMYLVIAALVDKKCLERATKGGGGHVAKYRIPGLRPGNWDAASTDLRPGIQDAESGSAPGAASRKAGHSASRFSVSCVPETGTPSPQPLNGAPVPARAVNDDGGSHFADIASATKSTTGGEAAGFAPLPSPNPGDDNGSEHRADRDQHIPAVVHLQSQATGGNAPASANGAGPRPATIQRHEARKQRILATIAARPGITGNELASAIGGGNRAQTLGMITQLRIDGLVIMTRDPADGRICRYTAAAP